MTGSQQLCTFYLDGYLFGIPVQKVQEVLLLQDLTAVPRAAAAVAGVINLRGQIVTVIDLRKCLDLPERRATQLAAEFRTLVVARLPGETVSFLVDDVGEVLQVEEAQFAPPPETFRGALLELVVGTYQRADNLLLLLNSERIVERAVSALEERAR